MDRLYILNCGEGVAGDISRWSPGVNVGKSMPFADNCYLINHTQGWLLWDTGLADTIAAMPDGLAPADPRAITATTETLAAQSKNSGSSLDIKYVAVSHSHPDHIGNVELFPHSMLLVQKAEYEWPTPIGSRASSPSMVTKLEGDHDVFGDGSVTIISTPGHTPGHQSLLVKLPKTGALVLSGDAVHFKSNWETGAFLRSISTGTRPCLDGAHRGHAGQENAQLWINHDKAQRDTLKMTPEFYE